MAGKIFVGIGGWTFEPWRGTFYPEDLARKSELNYASRQLTSIEINGTYYSTFKPASWAKWREEMEAVRIPTDDVLTLPDKDRWAQITALRGGGNNGQENTC